MNDNEIIAEMSRQFPKPEPTWSERLAASNPRWELQELTTIAHMNHRDKHMFEVVERIERAAIAELRSSILTEEVLNSPEILKIIKLRQEIAEAEEEGND